MSVYTISCYGSPDHIETSIKTTEIQKITFKATSKDVQPTPFDSPKGGDAWPEIIERFHKAFDSNVDEIVQTSAIPQTDNISVAYNGLVSAIVEAYNTHHNLVLRPDDIWQAILSQFSFYVNANSEGLKDKFVDFDGKKKLVVRTGGTLFTGGFGEFAKRMVDEQISTNLKDPEVTKWLLPSFTTTINDDRVAAAVTIMSTLQKYFEYSFSLGCGIPKVTMLGTVEDWKLLREKIDGLLKYEVEGQEPVMQKWHGLLSKVVDEFVKSVEGKPSLEFWDKVAHHQNMSGGNILSGWVTVFACFKGNGEWLGNVYGKNDWPFIDSSEIAEGAISVPVTVDDWGTIYNAKMIAGQMVFSIVGDDLDTIQPRSDWCLTIEGEDKNKKRSDKEL